MPSGHSIGEATGAWRYIKTGKAGLELLTFNSLASPHSYTYHQNRFRFIHLSLLLNRTEMAIIDSFKANTTSVEVPALRPSLTTIC